MKKIVYKFKENTLKTSYDKWKTGDRLIIVSRGDDVDEETLNGLGLEIGDKVIFWKYLENFGNYNGIEDGAIMILLNDGNKEALSKICFEFYDRGENKGV